MDKHRIFLTMPSAERITAAEYTDCGFEIHLPDEMRDSIQAPDCRLVSAQWPVDSKLSQTLWQLYRVRREVKNNKDDQLSVTPKSAEYLAAWTTTGNKATWRLEPGRYKLRVNSESSNNASRTTLEYEFSLPYPNAAEGDSSAAVLYREYVESLLDSLPHAANSRIFMQKLRSYLVANERVVMDGLREAATETLQQTQVSENVILDSLSAGVKRLTISKRESITQLKHAVRSTVDQLASFLENVKSAGEANDLAAAVHDKAASPVLHTLKLSPTDQAKLTRQLKDVQPDATDDHIKKYALQKQVFALVDQWLPSWAESGEIWGNDVLAHCQAALDSRLHVTRMLRQLGFYDERPNPAIFKGLEVDVIERVIEEWFRDGTDLRGYDSEGAFFAYLEAKVRNKNIDLQRQGNVHQMEGDFAEADAQIDKGTDESLADALRHATPQQPDVEAFNRGIERAARLQAENAARRGGRAINPTRLAEKMKKQVTPTLTISVFDHVSESAERIDVPLDGTWEIGRQTKEELQRFGEWTRPMIDRARKRVVLASLFHNTLSKQIVKIIPTFMMEEYLMLGRTVALQNPSSSYDLCLLGGQAGEIVVHPGDSYVTSGHLNFYYRVSEEQMNVAVDNQDVQAMRQRDFSIRIDIAFDDITAGELSDVLIAKHQWIDACGRSTLTGQSISCTRAPRG